MHNPRMAPFGERNSNQFHFRDMAMTILFLSHQIHFAVGCLVVQYTRNNNILSQPRRTCSSPL